MTSKCDFLPLNDIHALVQVLNEVSALNLKEPRAFRISTIHTQFKLKEKVKGKPAVELKKEINTTLKNVRLLFQLFPEFESFVYVISPFTSPEIQQPVIKNNVDLLQNDYKLTFKDFAGSPLYEKVLTYWEPPNITMPVPLLNKVLRQIDEASNSSCLLTTWFNFGHTPMPLVNFRTIAQTPDDSILSFYSDGSRAKAEFTFGDNDLPVFNQQNVKSDWEKCWLLLRLHVQQVLQQPEETEDPGDAALLQKDDDSGSEGYVSAKELKDAEGKAVEKKDEEGKEAGERKDEEKKDQEKKHESPTLAEEVPRYSLRKTAARAKRDETAAPRQPRLTKAEKAALAAARTEAKEAERKKAEQEEMLTAKYRELLKEKIYFHHKDVRKRNKNIPYNLTEFVKVALITPTYDYNIVYEFEFSKSLVTVLKSLVVPKKLKIYVVWILNDEQTTEHLRTFVNNTEKKFDHILFHQLKDNYENPIVKEFLGKEENVTALNETLSEEGSIIFHSKTRQLWKSLGDTVKITDMLPLESQAFTETFQYYFFFLDLHAYYKKSFIESENLDLFFPVKKIQSKEVEYASGNLQTVYMLYYTGLSFNCKEVNASKLGNKFSESYYPLNFVEEKSSCDNLQSEITKNWDIDRKVFTKKETPFVSKYVQQGKSSLFLAINELLLLKNDFKKLIDYNLLMGNEEGSIPWYLGNHVREDVDIVSLTSNYDSNIVDYNKWCYLLVYFYQTISLVVIDLDIKKMTVFQVENKQDVNVFYILTVKSKYYPLFPVFNVKFAKSEDIINNVATLFSVREKKNIIVPQPQYLE